MDPLSLLISAAMSAAIDAGANALFDGGGGNGGGGNGGSVMPDLGQGGLLSQGGNGGPPAAPQPPPPPQTQPEVAQPITPPTPLGTAAAGGATGGAAAAPPGFDLDPNMVKAIMAGLSSPSYQRPSAPGAQLAPRGGQIRAPLAGLLPGLTAPGMRRGFR